MVRLSHAATRLRLLLIGALLIVGGLMVVFVHGVRQWEALAAVQARESQEATLNGMVHTAMTRATAEAVSYTATGNQEYAREATDALLYAQSAMSQLRRIGTDRPEQNQSAKLAALRKQQEEVLSQVRHSVTEALQQRSGADAPTAERLEQIYAPEAEADRIWREVLAWHDAERRSIHQRLRAQRNHVLLIAIAALLASILGAVLVHTLVARDLLAPLRTLAREARRLADGEADIGIAVTTGGEIGALQQALSRVAQRLREQSPGAPARAENAEQGETDDQASAAQFDALDASTSVKPEIATQSRALLLCADANERELTRAMLQHCGMDVVIAQDTHEAVASLEARSVDVIVLDVHAAASGGHDAMFADRGRLDASGRIPMIVLGSETSTAAPPPWLIAGVDQYLERPFSFFELHAALSRHMPHA